MEPNRRAAPLLLEHKPTPRDSYSCQETKIASLSIACSPSSRSARSPGSPMGNCSSGLRCATAKRPRPHSPHWLNDAGHWSGARAVPSYATNTTLGMLDKFGDTPMAPSAAWAIAIKEAEANAPQEEVRTLIDQTARLAAR